MPNWEMFPVPVMGGVQMFGLSQQKGGEGKSQEKFCLQSGRFRINPHLFLRGRTARGFFQWRDWKLGEKRVKKEQKSEVELQETLG